MVGYDLLPLKHTDSERQEQVVTRLGELVLSLPSFCTSVFGSPFLLFWIMSLLESISHGILKWGMFLTNFFDFFNALV